MARLDVRKLKTTRGPTRLVVELQSNYMRDIPTVIVAPLISAKRRQPYKIINPVIASAGEQMTIRLEEMVGVPTALLGELVGSASSAEYEISVALNRLLFYL